MKILILADDFPPRAVGGGGRVAEQVASGYISRGHDVFVITTARSRSEEGDYKYNDVNVRAIFSNYHERWTAYYSLYNPSTVSKIKALINGYKPDVVHAHNIHRHISYYVLKLAKKTGAKVLLTAHDCMLFNYGKFDEYIDPKNLSIPTQFNYKINLWKQLTVYKKRYNPFRNIIIRHYVKYCDKICAVSSVLEKALNANGIMNTVVVHNGINIKQWIGWIESDVKPLFLIKIENRPVVGFVGWLNDAKGGIQLLKAFKEVKSYFPDSLLLIIGDPLAPSVKILANDLGILSSIIITGRLSGAELVSAYKACNVIAFPSLCLDTFGMVNIEAMLTGKPVVATCFGGSPEIIEDGITGRIVNPYNVQNMSKALIEFLDDPKKANEFGRRGRERVEKEFTIDHQIDKYLSIIQGK